ncbi:hypothetical protein Leryth_009167 [Lithospermum erythrorhizon]|nr:hypothetical protein Leryth_009167 [Lithospermum erythrorhizon]
MMGAKSTSIMPVVSKLFCSASEVILAVRNRPHVVSGGGFVVTSFINQKLVFEVDGCGVLGKKEELILKDADGNALLLIRRKGGMVEALSISRRWNGYKYNFDGSPELVFCLRDPNFSCLKNSTIKISLQSKQCTNKEFEIMGYFPDRDCSIVEQSSGIVIAQVGIGKELKHVTKSRDLYHVVIKPGIDQAFVFGVIAILDYIYDGSTRC